MRKLTLLAVAAALLCSCCGSGKQENMAKDFLTLATERYSVRKFSDVPVERGKIDRIIEAGRVAPTAVNSQPQRIFVATSPESVAKLNGITPCMYGAPHCFIFCCDTDRVCKRGDRGDYGDIDVTIVLTHMMLEAANLGLGTCPVGYFDPVKIADVLSLPSHIHPVLLMPFGYPASDAAPGPGHTNSRPIEDMVTYL